MFVPKDVKFIEHVFLIEQQASQSFMHPIPRPEAISQPQLDDRMTSII